MRAFLSADDWRHSIATSLETARKIFKESGGTLRTREALSAGVHPRTLYALRDAGVLQELTRGVYRLADLPPLGELDLVTVAKRVPHGIICLISALAYHELTTQIPHEVYLAISRTARQPILDAPPLRIFRFSETALTAGVDTHSIEGVAVRVYSPEKTIADCFKFRNKIGFDVARESLRLYRKRRRPKLSLILEYARVCRVEKVIRPYLEASE